MRNAVLALILVLAGATSSLTSHGGGSEDVPEVAAKGKSAILEGNTPQPIDDPIVLLDEFFEPAPASTAGPNSCNGLVDSLEALTSIYHAPCIPPAKEKRKKRPRDITFLIATVPDPERTHLGLYLDRFLEAIINAAGDEKFSYDRHWLPWHVSHDASNPDPAKQDILDGRVEARHRKPGIIIFRKAVGPLSKEAAQEAMAGRYDAAKTERQKQFAEIADKALVVFLVGETPTAGVNRYQFAYAAKAIRSEKAAISMRGILGPTFTGSSASLRSALTSDFPSVSPPVISGAVSSLSALAGFARGTVHSDDILSIALPGLLKELRHGRIAVLHESTDYGRSILLKSPLVQSLDPPLRIDYPREISRLRNVYPEQTDSAAAQVAHAQQQLLLHLRDSRLGEDTIPQFSDQTPLTQETVLLQISQTLRHEHVGIAVLTGTDVLDLLFLSRHLRELCPDIRLLLWDTDLLFVHGTDTLDFSGMLALSTYPLMPQNHYWTERSPEGDYYFPNGMTQGVYNACRFLLNPSDPKPREYSSPIDPNSKTPPVWLSAIGHDAYWPVELITPGVEDPFLVQNITATPGQLAAGWPPTSWTLSFTFASIMAGLYVYLNFHVLHLDPNRIPRWCSLLHPKPYRETAYPNVASPWRADYSFLLTLALLLTYLCLCVPVFRPEFYAQSGWEWMPWVGAIAILGFLAVLVMGGILAQSGMSLFMFLSGCLGIAFVVRFFVHWDAKPDPERFFRALRSVQLGSGLGPNLPLVFLFLALAWWASVQVQRARLVAEHRPLLPKIAGNHADANIEQVNAWLGQKFLYIDGFGALVATVAAMLSGCVGYFYVISIDRSPFDAAISVLLVLLSTLLFLSTYAFAKAWWALERLLEGLETQPIRFAFSNLPSDVSWSPLWQSGARRKSYTILVRSLDSLRALQKFAPGYYAKLGADIKRLDGLVGDILQSVNRGVEESIMQTEELQTLRSDMLKALFMTLRRNEWKYQHSESLEKFKKSAETPTTHTRIANFLGLGTSHDFNIITAPEEASPEDKPEMLAAEIIALGYLSYIRYIMRHLRNLLSFITTGFILATLAVNCYPFQMFNQLRWSVTLAFLGMGFTLVYTFQKMSRNEVLSRITDTKAGSLDKEFYTRVLSAGALPLLAVVASHFPSVGRFLFSWIKPTINALH